MNCKTFLAPTEVDNVFLQNSLDPSFPFNLLLIMLKFKPIYRMCSKYLCYERILLLLISFIFGHGCYYFYGFSSKIQIVPSVFVSSSFIE